MKKSIIYLMWACLTVALASSCKDKESYADLLRDENHAVNADRCVL
ncbi:MAG: DUF4827 domain-containing protein [Muribaculaceae bacterium]|nr:DUF4827 domain-containing protein [Muribaculaceae bacterium]